MKLNYKKSKTEIFGFLIGFIFAFLFINTGINLILFFTRETFVLFNLTYLTNYVAIPIIVFLVVFSGYLLKIRVMDDVFID